jgi:SAM-dependent methyltransferase
MVHPNPQKEQMEDESMARNLAAQAEAIWPAESKLVADYGLPEGARILDAGCGTGEFTVRLLAARPDLSVTGIDILPSRIALLRARRVPGASFMVGDLLHLDFPEAAFDFVACRHVLQSVPEPARAVAELARVLKPGGRIHLLAEDYGMLHFHPTRHDLDGFFQANMRAFREKTGVDYETGRHAAAWLQDLGFSRIEVNYVIVDSFRTPRDLLRRLFEAWRDGYARLISEVSGRPFDETVECFEDMMAASAHPPGYAVWFVPVVTGISRAGGRDGSG